MSKEKAMHRILLVGSSPTKLVEQWLADDEVQDVLVLEPHPVLAQQLRERYRGKNKLQVIEATLSQLPSPQLLMDYNLPGFSSLSPVSGLKRLFPGLKATQHYKVKTLTANDLFELYAPNAEQTATLFIQATGYEAQLVQELTNHPALLRFTEIVLRTGIEPLYVDSAETDMLIQQLRAHGYELTEQSLLSPEWVKSCLQRDPATDKINTLQNELAQANLNIAQQKKQVATQITELEQLKKAEQTAVKGQELLKNQLKELQTSFETDQKTTVKAQEQLQTQVKELQASLKIEQETVSKQAQQLKLLAIEVETATKELATKDKLIAEVQVQLQKEKDSKSTLSAQLKVTEQSLQDHKQWFSNRKKQAEELEVALKLEQEKNQQLQSEKDTLSQLESRMEQLFTQQASQIQQSTNALGKHVTQSFVNQRQHDQALTGLYQYLENGEQPLSFDGWAMSADTLTHLVRMVEQNNYDVIIEFGSGTSTVVMAKVIANRLMLNHSKHSDSQQLGYEGIETTQLKNVTHSQASSLVDTAEYDLPRQIISFEQDRKYLTQTQQALISHGLSNVVELVLAPLVPARHSVLDPAQKSLFYDCEKQLERLARLYEQRRARVLVVVDGPTSPKNFPLIREPALATILQYLSAHQIDVLLDDTMRDGEKEILKYWKALCDSRGLVSELSYMDVKKGACLMKVNI